MAYIHTKKRGGVAAKHAANIKRMNKKYPLMEYFVDRKPLKSCSPECQKQVKYLRTGER